MRQACNWHHLYTTIPSQLPESTRVLWVCDSRASISNIFVLFMFCFCFLLLSSLVLFSHQCSPCNTLLGTLLCLRTKLYHPGSTITLGYFSVKNAAKNSNCTFPHVCVVVSMCIYFLNLVWRISGWRDLMLYKVASRIIVIYMNGTLMHSGNLFNHQTGFKQSSRRD